MISWSKNTGVVSSKPGALFQAFVNVDDAVSIPGVENFPKMMNFPNEAESASSRRKVARWQQQQQQQRSEERTKKDSAPPPPRTSIPSTTPSSSSPRATLKDLRAEDKRRVANLIQELGKLSAEGEKSRAKLERERKTYETQIKKILRRHDCVLSEKQRLQEQYLECFKILLQCQETIGSGRNSAATVSTSASGAGGRDGEQGGESTSGTGNAERGDVAVSTRNATRADADVQTDASSLGDDSTRIKSSGTNAAPGRDYPVPYPYTYPFPPPFYPRSFSPPHRLHYDRPHLLYPDHSRVFSNLRMIPSESFPISPAPPFAAPAFHPSNYDALGRHSVPAPPLVAAAPFERQGVMYDTSPISDGVVPLRSGPDFATPPLHQDARENDGVATMESFRPIQTDNSITVRQTPTMNEEVGSCAAPKCEQTVEFETKNGASANVSRKKSAAGNVARENGAVGSVAREKGAAWSVAREKGASVQGKRKTVHEGASTAPSSSSSTSSSGESLARSPKTSVPTAAAESAAFSGGDGGGEGDGDKSREKLTELREALRREQDKLRTKLARQERYIRKKEKQLRRTGNNEGDSGRADNARQPLDDADSDDFCDGRRRRRRPLTSRRNDSRPKSKERLADLVDSIESSDRERIERSAFPLPLKSSTMIDLARDGDGRDALRDRKGPSAAGGNAQKCNEMMNRKPMAALPNSCIGGEFRKQNLNSGMRDSKSIVDLGRSGATRSTASGERSKKIEEAETNDDQENQLINDIFFLH